VTAIAVRSTGQGPSWDIGAIDALRVIPARDEGDEALLKHCVIDGKLCCLPVRVQAISRVNIQNVNANCLLHSCDYASTLETFDPINQL
jgi:hypothetical protein